MFPVVGNSLVALGYSCTMKLVELDNDGLLVFGDTNAVGCLYRGYGLESGNNPPPFYLENFAGLLVLIASHSFSASNKDWNSCVVKWFLHN